MLSPLPGGMPARTNTVNRQTMGQGRETVVALILRLRKLLLEAEKWSARAEKQPEEKTPANTNNCYNGDGQALRSEIVTVGEEEERKEEARIVVAL